MWHLASRQATTTAAMLSLARERTVLFTLAAVQFVNILDFMMVMPLGPDFAASLDIELSHLPVLAASYTAAAGVGGLLGSFVLDRFDRRPALVVALLGLALGTLGGALSVDLTTLALSRIVAGFFGGPATSLALAIVSDLIPAERRGRALGTVMMAFSVASVLGVPAGLELAHHGTWHTPFFVVGGMGFVAAAGAWWSLPPLRGHLVAASAPVRGTLEIALQTRSLTAFLMSTLSNAGLFIVIPNIAAFVQQNLAFPRDRMSTLYLAGGAASIVTIRLFGRLVDRFGSFPVGLVGTLLGNLVTYFFFAVGTPASPIYLLFVTFMLAGGLRNVANQTLLSKVPEPAERARFMAMESTIRHGALALGSSASSILLSTEGGRLVGMHDAALVSIAIVSLVPLVVLALERRVRREAAPAPQPAVS